MATLADITHLVIDMDGVLYRGDDPLPRLRQFFAFLRQHSIPFVLATNNSTRTPDQYVDKLARMGVEVAPEEVLTSGMALARVLAQEYPRGTRVHVFGMPSLRQAVANEGFTLADDDVELVVASMDRDVSYDKIKRASLLIRGGARFYATNLDPTQPTNEGLLPGTGSMIAALATATETDPTATGKPEPAMFQQAMVQMGAKPETTAIIGDRMDTDILGGQRAGMITIAVLSGSSSRSDAEEIGADFIFEDIAELLDAWQSAL
jgi:4-nitrophenyl phosphatase